MKSTSETAAEDTRLSELLENDDDFVFLRHLFQSSLSGLSVSVRFSVACFRNSMSTDHSDTAGKVDGKGKGSPDSLPILPASPDSFSNFLQKNFCGGAF